MARAVECRNNVRDVYGNLKTRMRILSWNVLADAYVRASYYPRTDPALLRPGARTLAILDHIAAEPADVFCLQEVEPALVSAARRRLAGWALYFEPKRGRPDGCAVLARPDIALTAVRALVFADGAPDRKDSGHIALLVQTQIAGCVVGIATTHLRWDAPGTPPASRWAVRQVNALLQQFRDAAHPWVVCGDLNIEADDPVYAMLLDFGLVDPAAGVLPPTANPSGRARRIDHILHTPGLAVVPLPTAVIDDETPLPSSAMPSDHVPIGIEVQGFSPNGAHPG